MYGFYALALAASISVWFLAIRAPLFIDETGVYWQISAGVSQIWSRTHQGLDPPAYYYILWLSTKILGTSEFALRLPSVIAMLGAVYLLYLAARELFDREIALIATIVYCLDPIAIFVSVDVRPYAFGALATSAAILILLRLRHSNSKWLAALFGFSAASILYFHYLFAAILPALILCFFTVKAGDRKALWRQFGIAGTVFALAFLPTLSGLHFLFSAPKSHVWLPAPGLSDLMWTLAPEWLVPIFGVTAIVAAAARARSDQKVHFEGWHILICASLALIPVLILYGISAGTPIHLFTPSHCMIAIPGIALCWALLISPFQSRAVRLLFCAALVTVTTYSYYKSPLARHHSFSWKYALEVAEKDASVDGAPVVICSDFPEANEITMPLDSAKESRFFAQLRYYKLSAPVVPLPRALNGEAIRVGSQFLQTAEQKHERFLALAFQPSYPTLDWLAERASGTYCIRKLGVFDGIEVLEFTYSPKHPAAVTVKTMNHAVAEAHIKN